MLSYLILSVTIYLFQMLTAVEANSQYYMYKFYSNV